MAVPPEDERGAGGEDARVHAPRARRALAIGAAAGLLLATASILEPGPEFPISDDVAAVVNGVEIRAADLERAVAALAADSRNPVGEPERARVLDRLIEEELLVQRARELGIDRHDRRVRSILVADMIDSIVADVGSFEPGDAEIEAFYGENADFFAHGGRARVRQIRVAVDGRRSDAEALAIAREAAARLRAGDDPAAVAAELGDAPVAPLPDALLPLTQLRTYLGPTPAKRAASLATGEVGDPVRGGSSYHVLQVVERVPGRLPPLGEMRPQVLAEMRRREGDRALRAYLDALRRDGDVRLPAP